MEDGLVLDMMHIHKKLWNVLILVVMEDGLVQNGNGNEDKAKQQS